MSDYYGHIGLAAASAAVWHWVYVRAATAWYRAKTRRLWEDFAQRECALRQLIAELREEKAMDDVLMQAMAECCKP